MTVAPTFDLLSHADALRLKAAYRLPETRRAEMGQYLTPAPLARLMASMLECSTSTVSLLDAGAGAGALFAAVVEMLCQRPERPERIHIVAYELEPALADCAEQTMELCRAACDRAATAFSGQVRRTDFLQHAASLLNANLLQPEPPVNSDPLRFTCAIQNPPYRKINTDSEPRRHLRSLGLETTNLYTGFLYAAMRLLGPGGEIVAITPRSFCNGRYYRPFREAFLHDMALRRLHVFDTRYDAFKDQDVLQETMILSAVKERFPQERVVISSGVTAADAFSWRETPYDQVVNSADPETFIRVVPDESARRVTDGMARFTMSLEELGLQVSTGRTVDFRATTYLRPEHVPGAAPLIWPLHLHDGYVEWPRPGAKRPNALLACPETARQFSPNGHYVLIKRFSAKEQNRRITAAVYDGSRVPDANRYGVAFENHLNYIHANGCGMERDMARGLTVYLNSTLVDEYFRLYSGHTQVNATDLRSLRYPTRDEITALGRHVGATFPSQSEVDDLMERNLFGMADEHNPIAVKRRIMEATSILAQLGLPPAQQNDRSAYTLLALLNLRLEQSWNEATAPLIGITPVMDFTEKYYGKRYAPNTRETFRRFTMHQFIDAGIAVLNPGEPDRPVNSPNNVYQIEAGALELIRSFGSDEWQRNLEAYLASVKTLKERYAREREMHRIPIMLPDGEKISLSPGGQNVLVEKILSDFCAYYTPGATPLYVGDTDEKWAYWKQEKLEALGVTVDSHGKMPDVIVHYTAKNWLVLIEAVTSHGPVNAKRHAELKQLFGHSSAGLVFVTAFLSRKVFGKYLHDITWETEVWLADAPTHLIHFNGERFLGPY